MRYTIDQTLALSWRAFSYGIRKSKFFITINCLILLGATILILLLAPSYGYIILALIASIFVIGTLLVLGYTALIQRFYGDNGRLSWVYTITPETIEIAAGQHLHQRFQRNELLWTCSFSQGTYFKHRRGSFILHYPVSPEQDVYAILQKYEWIRPARPILRNIITTISYVGFLAGIVYLTFLLTALRS